MTGRAVIREDGGLFLCPIRWHDGGMAHPSLPRALRITPVLIAFALTAACSGAAPADGEGGLAPGEAEKLRQAAQRLDAREPAPARAASERLEADVRTGIAAERKPEARK
jgi:hypothetical protein